MSALPEHAIPDSAPAVAITASIGRRAAALRASLGARLRTALATLGVAAVLVWGLSTDLEDYITPERGLGYVLGIAGATMMLLLLVYPLRKRLRKLGFVGTPVTWFRIHMILGVLGPVLILFHARFNLGSMNSSIALVSMLLVAFSGLIGRFIYTKIHYGLYGVKAELSDLQTDARLAREQLDHVLGPEAELSRRLQALELEVLSPPVTMLGAGLRIPVVALSTRMIGAAVKRELKQFSGQQAGSTGAGSPVQDVRDTWLYTKVFLGAVRKAVGLRFFERLFALWHFLHLPIFAMLLITAVVHVVAVHMF